MSLVRRVVRAQLKAERRSDRRAAVLKAGPQASAGNRVPLWHYHALLRDRDKSLGRPRKFASDGRPSGEFRP